MSDNRINNNPWMGLSSYEDPLYCGEKKYQFCGREEASFNLTHLIDRNPFVTLYGRTGIGKTSLLQAGVFPLLRMMGYAPVIVRLGNRSENEQHSFARCIIDQMQGDAYMDVVGPEAGSDREEEDVLWTYFSTHRFHRKSDGQEVRPVVVLDQFEENLMGTKADKQRAILLLKQLYMLLDNDKVVPQGYFDKNVFRIVISIREDDLFLLEDCIEKHYLFDLKNPRYRLVPLQRADAEQVIVSPGKDALPPDEAERANVVAAILRKAGHDEDDGSTLMLSLVCNRLYESARKKDSAHPVITASLVESMGDNLLKDFYLEATKALRDKTERRYIEDTLVDSNRRRNSVNLGEMNANCPQWQKLKGGTNGILQERNGKVELVHDMLAAAVYDIRESRTKKRRRIWLQVLITLLTLLLLAYVLLSQTYSFRAGSPEHPKPVQAKKYQRYDTGRPYIGRAAKTEVFLCDSTRIVAPPFADMKVTALHDTVDSALFLRTLRVSKNVRDIRISDCPMLASVYIEGDSLEYLKITNCPNVHHVHSDKGPLVLRDDYETDWDTKDTIERYREWSHWRGNHNQGRRIGDLIFSYDTTHLISGEYYTDSVLDLRDSIFLKLKWIDSFAFYHNIYVKKVIWDTSYRIRDVGMAAFAFCENLQSVEGINKIGVTSKFFEGTPALWNDNPEYPTYPGELYGVSSEPVCCTKTRRHSMTVLHDYPHALYIYSYPQIESLYLPWSNMPERTGLLNLSVYDYSKIVVYVPAGCASKYQYYPEMQKFKEIREYSVWRGMWITLSIFVFNGLHFFEGNTLWIIIGIGSVLLLWTLLIFLPVYNGNSGTRNRLLKTLGDTVWVTASGLLVWFTLYWFSYDHVVVENQLWSTVLSIAGTVLILWFMFSGIVKFQFKKSIRNAIASTKTFIQNLTQKDWRRSELPKLIRKHIIFIMVVLLVIGALFYRKASKAEKEHTQDVVSRVERIIDQHYGYHTDKTRKALAILLSEHKLNPKHYAKADSLFRASIAETGWGALDTIQLLPDSCSIWSTDVSEGGLRIHYQNSSQQRRTRFYSLVDSVSLLLDMEDAPERYLFRYPHYAYVSNEDSVRHHLFVRNVLTGKLEFEQTLDFSVDIRNIVIEPTGQYAYYYTSDSVYTISLSQGTLSTTNKYYGYGSNLQMYNKYLFLRNEEPDSTTIWDVDKVELMGTYNRNEIRLDLPKMYYIEARDTLEIFDVDREYATTITYPKITWLSRSWTDNGLISYNKDTILLWNLLAGDNTPVKITSYYRDSIQYHCIINGMVFVQADESDALFAYKQNDAGEWEPYISKAKDLHTYVYDAKRLLWGHLLMGERHILFCTKHNLVIPFSVDKMAVENELTTFNTMKSYYDCWISADGKYMCELVRYDGAPRIYRYPLGKTSIRQLLKAVKPNLDRIGMTKEELHNFGL